ncbi:zinc-binding dehydrogenase, partial [Burkholderia vietnamiensis]
GKLAWLLVHGSILSRVGASTKLGAVHKSERIHPVIDKVFPFEQAKEALEYLAQGRAKGKVVVKIK